MQSYSTFVPKEHLVSSTIIYNIIFREWFQSPGYGVKRFMASDQDYLNVATNSYLSASKAKNQYIAT